MVLSRSSAHAIGANKFKKTLAKKGSNTVVVKKPTHLYLNDKFIAIIEYNSAYENLLVLYLHNNDIRKIENLDSAVNLKSLYLQKNKISKIENLQCLNNLKKLYLGHNQISVLEGLENLNNLEELHIEKQRISGDSLCFDPRTIITISRNLEVLNISHNNIKSIACLSPLRYIKTVNISYNKLEDMRDVCDTVHNWYHLLDATFIGNPIVRQHRYRENIIAQTLRLSLLDSKEINETTRCFIKRFEQEKLNHSSKHSINLPDQIPSLPNNYPPPVQKAVSHSILKNLKPRFDDSTLGCDVNDIYMPWNALPKSANNPGKNLPALFKKQQKRSGNRHNLSNTFPHIP